MGDMHGGGPEPHDAFERVVLRAARNIRHYMPLYVIALVMLLVVAVLPSRAPQGQVVASASPETPGLTRATLGSGDTATVSDPDAEPPAEGSATTPGAPGATGAPGGATSEAGVTRSGSPCAAGVRQLPFSDYAAPCVDKFSGDNGGATARGVTKDTIKVVYRYDTNASSSLAGTALAAQAGFPTQDDRERVWRTLTDYFNKTFELYGRKVVLERQNMRESNPQSQEVGCSEAAAAADQMKAFAVLVAEEPFTTCAVQRKLVVANGNGYYAEPWYEKLRPYVWHVMPACDGPARDMADYVGRRLANKKAKWAGDAATVQQQRVFGLIVPNDPWFQYCGDAFVKALRDKYQVNVKSRFNYQIDVNTLPQQSAQAVVQFKADGVTTLFLMTEPISPIFLTQDANRQNWHPEWVTFGFGFTDNEGFARLWAQNQVNGHYWGMSQLSGVRMTDRNSEPHKVWALASPNQAPPTSSWEYLYFLTLNLFNMLQVAGPNLTAANMGAGMAKMPPAGEKTALFGRWHFGTTHTAMKDSREIFWDGDANAPDGKKGVFKETYGGRRFTGEQWPAEDPPIYR